MTTYRTGNHWGVTIVREGERTPEGHIVGAAELVAVVVNGDQALAERIVQLLNGPPYPPRCTFQRGVRGCMCEPWPDCRNTASTEPLEPCDHAHRADPNCVWPDGVCTCGEPEGHACTCDTAPNPDCPVHHGRKARGPKPPPVGPGCVCDGSGRTCPRHGAVI